MVNVQCACLADWYIFCLSPKMTWIGAAGEVGKFSDSTKSILIEDMVLPESKRASCDVLSICAIVEQTIRPEEVAA